MQLEKFSWRSRIKSFRYAFDGLQQFFITQHNAWIHAGATVAVIVLSIITRLHLQPFLFIITATGLVWIAELFNTAIEKICDLVCPQQNPQVKFIKDVAAAAVLVTAILAVVIACIIFIPILL